VAYFAAAFARSSGDWTGTELDLDEVESLDDLADLGRELSSDDGSVLILLEEEDDWFGVVRIEGEDDPRVYVSDASETARSPVGSVLAAAIAEQLGDADEDDGPPAGLPAGPYGDADLVSDLGLTADDLNGLAVATGLSPSEAVASLAEKLGFEPALESVR
jgi:putative tRNA adenosine deaminase-associated protein